MSNASLASILLVATLASTSGFPISGVVSDYPEPTWPIGAHTRR
jgi:hypothetical protein